ncbi:MAG: hypothetical protein KBH82_10380 [Syntrophorhabdaceae bacterium]|jgi:hypothetical protein|nr:hypothetical protein [Syntrophorhabdaceae bacterium]MDI9559995.1 hypothetical protein [Pseudomonadota bacterium]HPH41381.1 hypothetical protein [Syntrophorhabdaceae bacterium]HQI56946.1 hypothetical protein [Syntrophorhabdaceae bacterium]
MKVVNSEKKGFKDSRIQGVEWFSWYLFFKTYKRRGRVEKDRSQKKKSEGWRVGRLEG